MNYERKIVKPDSIEVGKPIELSTNTNIRVAGVDHRLATIEANRAFLESIIGDSDYIAIEANPTHLATPDQRNQKDLGDFNAFFAGIINIAIEQNKPIFFTDPLTDNADVTGFLANAEQLLGILAFAGSVLAGPVGILKLLGDIQMTKENLSTRREFLQSLPATAAFLGLSAAGLTYGGATDIGDTVDIGSILPNGFNPLEEIPVSLLGFRNIGVAYGLQRGAREGLIKGNGILFQGYAHKGAIQNNLNHPQEQNRDAFEGTLPYQICKATNTALRAQVWVPQGNTLVATVGFRLA